MAQAIGKCPSVVSREINRNKDKRSGAYNCDLAQRKATLRKRIK
ncbi:MAG: IS30 family transposase, partial [Bacteroidales bacterium]